MKSKNNICHSSTIILLTILASITFADKQDNAIKNIPDRFRDAPQCLTGPRLLHVGETMTFKFYLPMDINVDEGAIAELYVRYLEQAPLDMEIDSQQGLEWLKQLKHETIKLSFRNNLARFDYTPKLTGNYLLRWKVGGEIFYRYFAVIDDKYIVINMTSTQYVTVHYQDKKELNRRILHRTGTPTDYYLWANDFQEDNKDYQLLLDNNRYYGDMVMVMFPEDISVDYSENERYDEYKGAFERVVDLLPDIADTKAGRIGNTEINFPCILFRSPFNTSRGYTRTFKNLGLQNLCGLQCANERPWQGMPQFPYFASETDCRQPDQSPKGTVVTHQWDMAGSWHFLGPVSWHYEVAKQGCMYAKSPNKDKIVPDFKQTCHCLNAGLLEYENLTKMNGHPAFVCGPIFEAPPHVPTDFVDNYLRFMYFEAPKDYRLVYARSIDVAQYYLRHYEVTPRTIFVSTTDHHSYDTSWLPPMLQSGMSLARDHLSWDTRFMHHVMAERKSVSPDQKARDHANMSSMGLSHNSNEPMSLEFLLIEDQHRSIRFERQCPIPVWWYDYTEKLGTSNNGVALKHVETPLPKIKPLVWTKEGRDWKTTMHLETDKSFSNYAVCIWELPLEWNPAIDRVKVNAKETLLAFNPNGEYHLVLFFDLKQPETDLKIRLQSHKEEN